jgi:hypothetical protein
MLAHHGTIGFCNNSAPTCGNDDMVPSSDRLEDFGFQLAKSLLPVFDQYLSNGKPSTFKEQIVRVNKVPSQQSSNQAAYG